jgi:hypothetical protein
MAASAIHTVLTEEQLATRAKADPALKALLKEYRAQRAENKNIIIITDRHGKPGLQELK